MCPKCNSQPSTADITILSSVSEQVKATLISLLDSFGFNNESVLHKESLKYRSNCAWADVPIKMFREFAKYVHITYLKCDRCLSEGL